MKCQIELLVNFNYVNKSYTYLLEQREASLKKQTTTTTNLSDEVGRGEMLWIIPPLTKVVHNWGL